MKTKNAFILGILALVLLVGSLMYFSREEKDNSLRDEKDSPLQDEEVIIQDNFGQKIVYSMDVDQNEAKYKEHCAQLGGTFSNCGNPCAPNADTCASVCAYTCEDIPQDSDTLELSQYIDFRYGISLSYPQKLWSVEKNTMPPDTVFINIYKENEGDPEDLPIDHFSNRNHVSFYPNGIPTEGIRAQTIDFDLDISGISSENSKLYVLEDGTPFAAMLRPDNLPETWNQSGFIWMRALINNLETRCISDGQITDDADCSPPEGTGQIVRNGTVDKALWQEEIDILRSLRFLGNNQDDDIYIETPLPGGQITSPLEVSGQARGSWFFEGSFPIVLTDWDGKIIAESSATTSSNWMTEDYVPFTAILEFESPYLSRDPDFMKNGSLILQKSNPSGLPENDNALEIRVEYDQGAAKEKS